MSLGMCYTVGMITIEHIDDQTFNATVEWDMYLIEVEGTVWTEQEDNLWGDQVESVSTIAHFDAVTDMKVSSKMTGDEVEVLLSESLESDPRFFFFFNVALDFLSLLVFSLGGVTISPGGA